MTAHGLACARRGSGRLRADGQRRKAKNRLRSSALSLARSPPATSGRWLRLGSPSTSSTLPQAPALGSAAPIDDARNARQDDRTRTHRARLERDVEHRVEQAPAAERTGRLAQREHLRMRRRVLAQLALVVGHRDNLAAMHDHSADRHVAVFKRVLGLTNGQAHEEVVAWKEALAHRRHRSLPQCCARDAPPGGARAGLPHHHCSRNECPQAPSHSSPASPAAVRRSSAPPPSSSSSQQSAHRSVQEAAPRLPLAARSAARGGPRASSRPARRPPSTRTHRVRSLSSSRPAPRRGSAPRPRVLRAGSIQWRSRLTHGCCAWRRG